MVLGSRGNACTGTVLAPRVVITAAHCVSGSPRYAVAYREGESPVLQEVADVARHPEFKAGARVSIDLALVRLKLPLPARFSPSALDADRDDEKVGGTLTIAGFGLGREGDEASAGRLRQAGVTVLPRYFPRYFRLGRSDDGVLICRGDSGGPVFDADLRLAGIVYGKERSDGRACGTVAQAVRIAPQRAWIDGVLTRWR
jgi:S1-C subfamily serine protease